MHLPRRFAEAILLGLILSVTASPGGLAAEFDRDKISRISSSMQHFVDDGSLAGSVTVIATRDKIVRIDAVGFSDLARRSPMREDDLFWIASMTKPMTAVCVLMLQDEGKLSVEDPVEKYLPEFKGQWLVVEKSTATVSLKRPARPITIRDLLTHTAGLGDVPAPRPHSTLGELAMAYAREPLQFEPGSRWSYSNPGINTLGRIVEVVSGKLFAEFLEARVLKPVGMKDTTFWPTPSQQKRIAKSYEPAPGGGLREVGVYFIQGALEDRQRTAFPAGGLFSTARDMTKFYQMMLRGGVWNGKRLLSQPAVGQLTRTQSGSIKTGFTDGMSWGFGFQVVKDPQGVTGMLSPGTFGHGGAYGTQSWADPAKAIVHVMMIQRAKLANGDASPMRRAFQEAAAASVK